MKKMIIILLIFSFLMPQEPCTGTCYTEEEEQNIELHIQELEIKGNQNTKIIENLNSQIYMYIQNEKNDSLLIEDYKKQIELQEQLMKELKPKWHENKYLWYAGGILSMILPIWGVGQVSK